MTKEMVEVSWGKPKKINRTVGGHMNFEQWIYDDDQYLYFDGNPMWIFRAVHTLECAIAK
jgi:hypothetical protein